jgi:menaquinone-dependent protoporphyrinogen oxidase
VRVLVTAATKYGATAEIANAVAGGLRRRGFDVDEPQPDDVDADAVEGYDAVVLGSAVYAGHWLPPARDLAERAGPSLARRPLWLFSSGPVGDPPKPEEDPVDLGGLVDRTGARDHRVFAGRIVRKHLSFPERAMVMALRVKDGDFRDWDEIDRWTAGIADALDAGAEPR